MSKSVTTECVVTLPNGEEALKIQVINDGTGDQELGNYNVIYLQRGKYIGRARVENYKRGAGMIGMIGFLMLQLDLCVENTEKSHAINDVIYGEPIPSVKLKDALVGTRFQSQHAEDDDGD